MKKAEKIAALEKKTIGVWYDGLAGIELKDIEYGIEDYAIVVGYSKDVHRLKICTSPDGDNYICLYHRFYSFSDCIRV